MHLLDPVEKVCFDLEVEPQSAFEFEETAYSVDKVKVLEPALDIHMPSVFQVD